MTFGPSIRLSVLHQRFPEVPRIALTATADALTRDEIRRATGARGAREFVFGFDRPNIRYRSSRRTTAQRKLLDFSMPRTRARRDRLAFAPQGRGDRRVRSRSRVACAALPRRHETWPTATANQSRFLREDGIGHGGDHRLRHGDRQARRALCGASRPAQEHRGLLPGDRPRRPRRAACRRVDGLRTGATWCSCAG